ncbi:MAG: UPF0175 family protein [Rhodoferax sp.]|nr:UPF0175 family protein [Rhodoferax sp.]
MAIKLYDDGIISLGKAAKLAGLGQEAFMQVLGAMAIPVVRYPSTDVADEVRSFLESITPP